jgi:hypothetical protein
MKRNPVTMLKHLSGVAAFVLLGGGAVREVRSPVPSVDPIAPALVADARRGAHEVDLAEIESLVKAASARFKGSALRDLVVQVEARVREQVPAYAADAGWIASTRAMATRLATPVPATPIEFGPIRSVSEKTGRPKTTGPAEIFQTRTVTYRFGTRDFFRGVEEPKSKAPIEPKDVAPAHQLTWLLTGQVPEVELAVAAMQRELDVDRSRDKLSRFLEYWRNGHESFYQALDRTAGTTEAVFFYDAMLGEFTSKLAPELLKARTLSEKHDRLHEAFLTLRRYRRFIEASSLTLVSTEPFPVRLKDFEYSAIPGSAQVRDGIELVLASHRWDVAKAAEDLKAVLVASPMPNDLWGTYDTPSIFIKWFLANSAAIKARINAHMPGSAKKVDAALAIECRGKRREIEHAIRAAARTALQDHGITRK